MKTLTALMLGLFVLSSCSTDAPGRRNKVMGFAPVYGTKAEIMASVKMLPARNLTQPGKIYVYNNLLFVNDAHEGVLVIDNSDPSNPDKLGFLSIPGNNDIAIRNGYLYADFGVGIATLDISDINNPTATHFLERNPNEVSLTPPNWMVDKYRSQIEEDRVYFECVDTEKGIITKWEFKELSKPECYQSSNFRF